VVFILRTSFVFADQPTPIPRDRIMVIHYWIFKAQDFKAMLTNRTLHDVMQDSAIDEKALATGYCELPSSMSFKTKALQLHFKLSKPRIIKPDVEAIDSLISLDTGSKAEFYTERQTIVNHDYHNYFANLEEDDGQKEESRVIIVLKWPKPIL
jgi:hypothetical protein